MARRRCSVSVATNGNEGIDDGLDDDHVAIIILVVESDTAVMPSDFAHLDSSP
jgi:fructose-specific phosphotransferase system component IIB